MSQSSSFVGKKTRSSSELECRLWDAGGMRMEADRRLKGQWDISISVGAEEKVRSCDGAIVIHHQFTRIQMTSLLLLYPYPSRQIKRYKAQSLPPLCAIREEILSFSKCFIEAKIKNLNMTQMKAVRIVKAGGKVTAELRDESLPTPGPTLLH